MAHDVAASQPTPAAILAAVQQAAPKPPEVKPQPWTVTSKDVDSKGVDPTEIKRNLIDLNQWVESEFEPFWDHEVPECWFWHKGMVMYLLALRRLLRNLTYAAEGASAAQLMSVLGAGIYREFDDGLVERHKKNAPNGHNKHQKIGLQDFIQLGWMEYIYCGGPEPTKEAGEIYAGADEE